MEDGYEFQANRQLLTIFSAPNYCGEFDNAGAIMVVNAELVCSFKIIRPMSHKARIEEDKWNDQKKLIFVLKKLYSFTQDKINFFECVQKFWKIQTFRV